jgi:hypothetical protein
VPKILAIGIALYIVALIDDFWGAPTFFLILGTPSQSPAFAEKNHFR